MSNRRITGCGERKFENVSRLKLVEEISKEEGLSPKIVEKILFGFFGKVKRYVNEGKAVELRGFGSFSALKIKRKGFYGLEHETEEDRVKVKVKFKPSKYFVNKVNKIQER